MDILKFAIDTIPQSTSKPLETEKRLRDIQKRPKHCLFIGMCGPIPQLLCVATCLAVVSCGSKRTSTDFLQAGVSAFEAADYPAAVSNFSKTVELNPKDADAFHLRGMSKWWLHDYRSAVVDYDQAIALRPDFAPFYCNRGQAKFCMQMCDEALTDYNKAIELDPRGGETYFNRGSLKFLSLKNYPEAILDYTKAIDLQTDQHSEDIYFMRGCARHELNNFPGAIADYTKALALNSNADWPNRKRAREYLEAAQKSMKPPWQ